MKQQIKSFSQRVLNTLFRSRQLAVRVDELERELDEYRRDSLRVAEMLDLIEARLTPGINNPKLPNN
ncbi:DUF6752 domain-containing protein [Leucobacter sp. G161]|uniref:DUF6752 domain-containing protein n=1 Tax=Leucobacter sp. G161 TaxID=663704 RepID=UPI00073B980A|nr:DUF6752 domain-containing protein [Leucobacter sp. G161]KUF08594.1 hypothetical protein AUL38_00335 [Leucobacter sp. G161]